MKTTAVIAFLLMGLGSMAQESQPIDMRLIGQYQEQAANYRDHAWIGSAVVVGFGALILRHANEEDKRAGWSLITLGVGVNIGLHIHANALDRRAARIMQGKPPRILE